MVKIGLDFVICSLSLDWTENVIQASIENLNFIVYFKTFKLIFY